MGERKEEEDGSQWESSAHDHYIWRARERKEGGKRRRTLLAVSTSVLFSSVGYARDGCQKEGSSSEWGRKKGEVGILANLKEEGTPQGTSTHHVPPPTKTGWSERVLQMKPDFLKNRVKFSCSNKNG